VRTVKGRMFTPDGEFVPGSIEINNGNITAVNILAESELSEDESSVFLIPGLIDIHTHGCFGHDACTASCDELKEIAKYQVDHGITGFLMATMTLPEDKLTKVCDSILSVSKECSAIKGIYLEGPFISYGKRGAQNADYIREPDLSLINRLQEKAAGLIKIVTIAPEVKGAIEVIRNGSKNILFSIAHTEADCDITNQAIEAGATHVTHLYNAMPPYSHREPGVIGPVMDSEDTRVELICDGLHVHPLVIRNTFKMFGPDRVILISDSMEATGMEDGVYSLGGQKVIMKDGAARLSDGTIAGSVTNLFDCMMYAIRNGVSAKDAIFAATRNPAISVGIYDQVGSLETGKRADILILDKDYNLLEVISE